MTGSRSESGEDRLDVVLPAAVDGERIDRVLAMLIGCPRSEVARLVAGGGVSVAGRPVTAGSLRVRGGQRLVSPLPVPRSSAARPDPTVLVPVLHADPSLLVVDKPAGLVVHPGAGQQSGTMVSGLLAAYPDLLAAGGDPDRPGIVHRLDRGTSGLLVVARTAVARIALSEQLAARLVTRRYRCLVEGAVEADSGLVDAPLGRSLRHPTRFEVRADGRPARTRYTVEDRFGGAFSLLTCELETGRTHQIRVHMAAIGHPVVGDDAYGTGSGLLDLADGRVFLHAGELAFDHPDTGRRVDFESGLPSDLAAALDGLVK